MQNGANAKSSDSAYVTPSCIDIASAENMIVAATTMTIIVFGRHPKHAVIPSISWTAA